LNTSRIKISAYILCYNNEETIERSIKSILNLNSKPEQIFVVDDGSNDKSLQIIKDLNIEVLVNRKNFGRGYSRARAINHANFEYILTCDATNILKQNFIEKTLPYFSDEKVVSVSGFLKSENVKCAVSRWRSRHLFKEDIKPGPAVPCEMLITYGTIMKRSPILEVGNFNQKMTHTEDNELGLRLYAKGYKIIGVPDPLVLSIAKPSLFKTLERYNRWNMGINEELSFSLYLRNIKASIRPMAEKDLRKKDFIAVFISMLCPHYCLLKMISIKISNCLILLKKNENRCCI
jgi:biofilm PGA synthesis N-glycosyltransferase PgaC